MYLHMYVAPNWAMYSMHSIVVLQALLYLYTLGTRTRDLLCPWPLPRRQNLSFTLRKFIFSFLFFFFTPSCRVNAHIETTWGSQIWLFALCRELRPNHWAVGAGFTDTAAVTVYIIMYMYVEFDILVRFALRTVCLCMSVDNFFDGKKLSFIFYASSAAVSKNF
jgi:hypothetical protein